MMIELMFPDGTVVSGATFRETERALRASQWTVFSSRRRFRREMKRRAVLWAGPRVSFPLIQTSEGFLRSLAAHGVCRMEISEERGSM